MVDIFGREIAFLKEFAEDLASSLRVIAYVYANDVRFIRKRQRDIKKTYERFLEDIDSDTGTLRVIPAYDALQGLLDGNSTPEQIRGICENALADYLWDDPEELSEDYPKPFEEFYQDD
ncbi:MAG: hypothetical protein NTY20_00560 [Candidatus Aenigmarchaeota archaeon]|nr:hypothetical protein [Candidatus Aenigmarchaeota archaeon]